MDSLEKMLSRGKSALQWQIIGTRSHTGICLPLSALHTAKSGGIGEFLDLIPLMDWCLELKMDLIQLLPLQDTGFETSPYNAVSSCALHPIYLSLYALPHLEDPSLKEKIKELEQLNSSERVDFTTVLSHKMNLFALYFEKYGSHIIECEKFHLFIKENPWIKPYALFKVFQHQMDGASFFSWPDELKYPSAQKYKELLSTYAKDMSFYLALQYLCYEQLREVKEQADAKKILLKGDIPLLINPNSADVWFHPEFFNLDLSIGAPPDIYCKEGQNWGFPGLHWMAMKKEGFSWWKNRLSYASNFYHLYRIDHAVGIFRLWAIPQGKNAPEGSFVPADENLWGPHGSEILDTFLQVSSMLPIAEDLGVVPRIVRPILAEFGIPGTKVMRWERNWDGDHTFTSPLKYPKLSLTCISTHDSPTLEQWWRDYPEESAVYAKQKGWAYHPKITQDQRKTILEESNSSASLFHISLLSEYLALVPDFVFPNPNHERINVPGTTLATNWTYKFRKSLEEMASSELLKEAIQSVLPKK